MGCARSSALVHDADLLLHSWLEYGLRNSQQSFRWRFPLSFQIIFLFILLLSINFFVESPRWLARNGREDDVSRY